MENELLNKVIGHLVYEHGTRTIRQKPGNYMIARQNGSGGWICDPDLACDKALAVLVFKTLLTYSNKYANGHDLLKELELMAGKVRSVCVDARAVEIEFGRGCHCEETADELSRTLDEIAEVGGPVCPKCGTHFLMTSVCVLLKENE